MSDNNDNRVIIKFEIQVPTGGGQAPIVINPAPGPTPTPPQPAPGPSPPQPVSASTPIKLSPVLAALTSVGTPMLVKVNGLETTGVVCIQATNDLDPICGAPTDVRVAIHAPGSNITATPSGDTAAASVGGSFANWKATSVPGAKCNPPATGTGVGSARNELIIWRKYLGEPNWSIEVILFHGVCSDETDCDSYLLPPAPLPPSAFDTVPASLELVGRGFGGFLEKLNQPLRLKYVAKQQPGQARWESTGDGVHEPRAELVCRQTGDVCELRLYSAGRLIIYQLPPSSFQPLAANRLQWSGRRDGLENCKFPTDVQIVPAG